MSILALMGLEELNKILFDFQSRMQDCISDS